MSVDLHRGKWRARISVNGERTELGRFDSEPEARAAYESALAQRGSERTRKPRPFADPRERFAEKCQAAASGCVLFMGAKDKDGYGKFQINEPGAQTHVRAHRYAFFLANGNWPANLVLHSCDTPACVNPEHLSEGTQTENLQQCAYRGRRESLRLTPDLVRVVRSRHADGERVTDIARDLNIDRETIFAAVHRRTWRHVA